MPRDCGPRPTLGLHGVSGARALKCAPKGFAIFNGGVGDQFTDHPEALEIAARLGSWAGSFGLAVTSGGAEIVNQQMIGRRRLFRLA